MNNQMRSFLMKNKILSILLLISFSIIIFAGATINFPVIWGMDYKTVNYYIEILRDISVGYIVSLIFYIIVVYIPETEKEERIRSIYRDKFLLVGRKLQELVNTTLTAIDFPTEYQENVWDAWEMFIDGLGENEDIDFIEFLSKKIDESSHFVGEYRECDTYYDKLIKISNEFNALKSEINSYKYYFNDNESEIYKRLENMPIFNNLKNFYSKYHQHAGINIFYALQIHDIMLLCNDISAMVGYSVICFKNEKETNRYMKDTYDEYI